METKWCWAAALALMLLGLAVQPSSGMAQMPMGDADPMAQLELGNAQQRAEALVWLAEHGSQGESHAIAGHLRDRDPAIRSLTEQTLWAIWTRSGNEQADGLMREGIELLGEERYADSIARFTELVKRLPDYAEGYNKRATALYLAGDYEHSLQDIDATLARNPDHFGALSGAGMCMLKLHRPADALTFFQRALTVNPNLENIRGLIEELKKLGARPMA